jgi:hypothetical protein
MPEGQLPTIASQFTRLLRFGGEGGMKFRLLNALRVRVTVSRVVPIKLPISSWVNGKDLYGVICREDLEGIVAKHKDGPYTSAPISWFKIINPNYSQHAGRREMFDRFRDKRNDGDGRPGGLEPLTS